ncbi:GNAT family N-acetyltransferase, partial [Vagococcus silagei]
MEIIYERDSVAKKLIAKEVLADLPEWFGLPESTDEYVSKCMNYPLWVAKDGKNIMGFISLKETSHYTGEIYCMGVKKAYQRIGVGSELIRKLTTYCLGKYKLLQVKTVAEGRYCAYDQTISFYKSLGFFELEVF